MLQRTRRETKREGDRQREEETEFAFSLMLVALNVVSGYIYMIN